MSTSISIDPMAPPLKPLNSNLSTIPTTIFSVMSALAVEHGSVNLGQGCVLKDLTPGSIIHDMTLYLSHSFPDDEGPESMKRIAGEALLNPFHNQYPPMV